MTLEQDLSNGHGFEEEIINKQTKPSKPSFIPKNEYDGERCKEKNEE